MEEKDKSFNKTEFKINPPKNTGDTCPDCNYNQCICFSYLSKPNVVIQEDGKLLIKFDSDWDLEDKKNFLLNARYILKRWANEG